MMPMTDIRFNHRDIHHHLLPTRKKTIQSASKAAEELFRSRRIRKKRTEKAEKLAL